MTGMKTFWLAPLLAALLAAPAAAQGDPLVAQTPTALNFLNIRLAEAARTPAGRIGVAATDLATGKTIAVNAAEAFPMASASKLAIAAAYLDLVDQGQLRLTTLYPLDEAMRVRSDGITAMLPHPGVALSAANLIELSLTVSDNSATDILLQAVGGPRAVTAWLKAKGIAGQRVDRSIARLLIDVSGKSPDPALADGPALATFMPVEPWRTDDEKWPVNPAFEADPRDTSTPNAMVALLAGLHGGKLLRPDTTRFLFEVLARCKTGGKRVKALLPANTPWAHKTGTLPGISNDVGVLTLPNGHAVAIAVFSKGIADAGQRDAKLAAIGRLIYDGFAQ